MTRITPYTALKVATREKGGVADHIDRSLDKASDNLNALIANLDRNRVIEMAKLIHRRRRTLIVGLDFAVSLAEYFAYVAPVALISAIHVACAHINPKRSLTLLKPTDKEYLSGSRWYREPKGFDGNLR